MHAYIQAFKIFGAIALELLNMLLNMLFELIYLYFSFFLMLNFFFLSFLH